MLNNDFYVGSECLGAIQVLEEGISTALKESAEELEIVGFERVRMIMKLVLPKVIKGYKMYSKL